MRSRCSDRLELGNGPVPSLRDVSMSKGIVCVGAFSGALYSAIQVDCVILPSRLTRQFCERLSFCSYAMSGFRRCALTRFVGSKTFRGRVGQLHGCCRRGESEVLRTFLRKTLGAGVGVLRRSTKMRFLVGMSAGLDRRRFLSGVGDGKVGLTTLSSCCRSDRGGGGCRGVCIVGCSFISYRGVRCITGVVARIR